MDQLEYVIEELERALRVWLHAKTDRNLMLVQPDVVEDALKLLKEKLPIRPNEFDPVICGCRYTCGACRHKLVWKMNFCPTCGRKVKWDG